MPAKQRSPAEAQWEEHRRAPHPGLPTTLSSSDGVSLQWASRPRKRGPQGKGVQEQQEGMRLVPSGAAAPRPDSRLGAPLTSRSL